MPTISMFYGIIVRMYAEKNAPHNRPHIHASYSGHEAVLALDGSLIDGDLPSGKMKLLLAWMEIHRDELEADWQLLCNQEAAFKIEPLR